ncbi:E3 ubiquitin-protein ligase RNF31 isoform X2 [Protopterus annectens]|uniref:E3 ubiquitin-protein ligase RNF31 isoform X2 n=1 Tax=Protopterus annectens TaxID=7888 RepID=UPI001CFB5716|nr:E3 ubiquitin-protein ligase RNF31 isoform X2 [Protopterus annectens]
MPEEVSKLRLAALRKQAIVALMHQPAEAYRDAVQAIVEVDLSFEQKYQVVDVVNILRMNITSNNVQMGLNMISKAFNILEKYGRNLLNPKKPHFWRCVKFNNPVFKNTVNAIQGGKEVLYLYGYTEEQSDGLNFPNSVPEPDERKVASVTVDVTLLRLELDHIIKGTHPHPEAFRQVISQQILNSEAKESALVSDAIPFVETTTPYIQPPEQMETTTRYIQTPMQTVLSSESNLALPCNLCGEEKVSVQCPSCNQSFCSECDIRFHKHPARADHQRLPLPLKRQRYDCQVKSGSFDGDVPVLRTPAITDTNRPVSADTSGGQRALGAPFSPSLLGSTLLPTNYVKPVASIALGVCQSPDRITKYQRSTWTQSASPCNDPPQEMGLDASVTRMPWECQSCTYLNEARAMLCVGCDRPKGCKTTSVIDVAGKSLLSRGKWSCQTCTFENEPSAVLCEACKRPRLSGKPSFREPKTMNLPVVQPCSSEKPDEGWHCQHCTYWNSKPGRICEVCNRTSSIAASSQPTTSNTAPELPTVGLKERITALQSKLIKGIENTGVAAHEEPHQKAGSVINEAEEWKRQEELRAAGQKLVKMIRSGEENGSSPEEVYCAFLYSGTEVPVQWLQTELPSVLEVIVDHVIQKGQVMPENTVGRITQEEARHSWLACSGNVEDAVQECINIRKKKVLEIQSMGFKNKDEILDSLYRNAGDVQKALTDLQGKLLEPFHTRMWNEHEPQIHSNMPDRARLLRRILGTFGLPSWGRAELVLTFLQEDDQSYSLHDVIEAVRQSHDRQIIKRMLSHECSVCMASYPRNRMRSLTSCECMICQECFQLHFTIVLKERHIKDMVCPGCSLPEITDEDELLSYFSTLDIQLRDCLDEDAYQLFNKKLTDWTLMKDPKFKWCTHCSFGFIYDGDQMKVTCTQCKKSFCSSCRRPWEDQHQGITCDEFQNWKQENDPEYQTQGLAKFLNENGIECPKCKFQYALSKGGCMHFKCTQCRHEFCSGCYNMFLAGNKCTVQNCSLKKSLHAHHPRDCLSYLRDWDVERLKKLLMMKAVHFNTEPPAGTHATPGGCRVMEQKEYPDGLRDEPCGKEATDGYAGLCKVHYQEYLVSLINAHSLDPAVLYEVEELEVVLRRYHVDFQGQAAGETAEAYKARMQQDRGRLVQKLMAEVPLDDRVPRKKRY